YTTTIVDACGYTETRVMNNPSTNGVPNITIDAYTGEAYCPMWKVPGTSQVRVYLGGYIKDQVNAVVTITSGPSNVGVAGTHIWNGNYMYWTNMVDGTYTVSIVSCGQTQNATFTVASSPGQKLQLGLSSSAQNVCVGKGNILSNISYNGGHTVSVELYDINNNLVLTSPSGNFWGIDNGKYHTKMKISGCGTSFYVDGNDVTLASGGAMKISYAIGVVCEDASGNPTTTGTAYVQLVGVAPYTLNYRIKGTSTWTTISNANQDNVITGLQAGNTYDLQFNDSCGAQYNSSVKIRTIAKVGLVTNSQPCYNQPFSLEAMQYQGATYQWRKGSATGPIVSSTYKYDIANYTAADDATYVCIISWGTCATRYLTIATDGSKCGQTLYTPIVAAPDINQTPVNVPVSGNVKTNDSGDNITVVASEQDGVNIPIGGAATQVAGVDALGNPVANAGTIILNADGSYVFTPAPGFVGTVNTITYNIKSSQGFIASTTLDITVIPVVNPALNNAPIANNDTATTEVNTPVTSTVINNDKDPDGDALTVTGATQIGGSPLTIGTATTVSGVDSLGNTVANAGTVTLNANGTYTYTPATGFVGTVDPIKYTISDGNGGTDNAILYIDVTPNSGNQTFANDDANLAPKGVTMSGNVLTNDTDPEGNTQTVTGATVTNVKGNPITPITVTPGTATNIPGVGVLTLNANGTYTFVPAAGFVGTVVVPYTKCDNGTPVACDTATLYLTSLDSGPVATPDINQTPVNVPVSGNVLTNDSGNAIKVSAASQGSSIITIGTPTQVSGVDVNGNAVANAGSITINQDGSYIYTPAPGFVGNVNQISYTIKDSSNNQVSTTLDITVIPLVSTTSNDAPIANNDTATTEVNTPVSSTVINNDSDPDGDTLTVTGAVQTGGGTLTIGTATPVSGVDSFGNPVANAGTVKLNADGTYTFTPANHFVGTINPIKYTISDGHGGTDTAFLYINVTPNSGNQTFANDDANAAPRGVTMNGNVLSNDTDPEGNTQTVT
ncbi:MAG: tandem-95 repeat protein, partial [Bacteroidetes bacterium]|nr:tandem-95 repeat protein [Bacteroidota bacterium]